MASLTWGGCTRRRDFFGAATRALESAVVDGDDLLDVVQLHRRGDVVPERLVPVLERRRDGADGRARDRELAVLAAQPALVQVRADGLLEARVDARERHRFVVAGGGEDDGRAHERDGTTGGGELQEVTARSHEARDDEVDDYQIYPRAQPIV
jgi:hypothetical protein